MEHTGGKSIGGHAIATGAQKKLFDNLTIEGEVDAIDLVITGTLISTGAAFNAKNPSGSSKTGRGGDDADKMLDFIYTNAMLRVNEVAKLFDAVLMSRVRSICEAILERDVEVSGLFVDGTSIPISTGAAAAFGIRLTIPFSMRDGLMEEDGDAYKVGTAALAKGGFFPNVNAISGAVALANGTATLAALAVDMVPHVDAHGDPYYSGPSWKLEADENLAAEVTTTTLRRAKRIMVLDDSVSHGPYTMHGDVETDQMAAADFISKFNRNRRRGGPAAGSNLTNRHVPLVFPRRNLKLAEQDFTPSTIYVKNHGGQTQALLSLIHEPENKAVAARLDAEARIANGGKAPAKTTPTPPSAAGTNKVAARNATVLGTHRHVTAGK